MQKTVVSFMNNLGCTKWLLESWGKKDAIFSDLRCTKHKTNVPQQYVQCVQSIALQILMLTL